MLWMPCRCCCGPLQVEAAFGECRSYLEDYPALSQNEVECERFLQNQMRKIRSLGVGDVMMIPAGWANVGPTARPVLEQQAEREKVRPTTPHHSGMPQLARPRSLVLSCTFCASAHTHLLPCCPHVCVCLRTQDPKLPGPKPELGNLQAGLHVGMGHWVLCVLDRPRTDHFRLAVINQTMGSGLEYHPCSAAQQPHLKRKLAFVIDEIPVPRLHDSSFWFMLMKLQVWPLDQSISGPKFVYETLLPYLNDKPLYQNMPLSAGEKYKMSEKSGGITANSLMASSSSSSSGVGGIDGESSDDLVEWRVLSRLGDPHHIQLALEAMAYMLRALGVSRAKTNYFVHVVFKCQQIGRGGVGQCAETKDEQRCTPPIGSRNELTTAHRFRRRCPSLVFLVWFCFLLVFFLFRELHSHVCNGLALRAVSDSERRVSAADRSEAAVAVGVALGAGPAVVPARCVGRALLRLRGRHPAAAHSARARTAG